jgi:hypothetical protein
MNFSAILDKIGVTDIGRKSFNDFGCWVLGTGVTIACLQVLGTVP